MYNFRPYLKYFFHYRQNCNLLSKIVDLVALAFEKLFNMTISENELGRLNIYYNSIRQKCILILLNHFKTVKYIVNSNNSVYIPTLCQNR